MRLIIITGVSRGLGAALFTLLKNERLLCISRQFTDTQRHIAKESDGRIILLRRDLRDVNHGPAFADSLMWRAFLVSFTAYLANATEIIFINNAGVIEPIGPIGTLNEGEIEDAIAINFMAPAILINKIICQGVPVKILNISTGAAIRPIESWSMYCSTKSAARMFFDCLEKEKKAQVIHIDPGAMDTAMQTTIRESMEFPEQEKFITLKKEHRLRAPEDVAREIVEAYL